MVRSVAAAPRVYEPNLAAVRAWWRVRHPPPSLGQRLDVLYTAAITIAIVGALAYGTASSALAQVVTPHALAVFGPSLAMLALLVTAHWGIYQGPVVFSVADVAHLLGSPLPRRGLASRRLVLALAGGAAAGALAAGATIVGLAGEGRGIASDQAAGLTIGLAELGALAVAATWAVERSARWEGAVRRAAWPAVLLAAALAAVSDGGQVGRQIVLWSGPWGWAAQPGAGVDRVEWLAGLVVLSLLAAGAAVAAVRDCGDCHTERHVRRAEARTSAIASLASFDARGARQALEAVGTRPSRSGAAQLRWLRTRIAAWIARRPATALAIIWRDVVAARRAPGRIVEAAALAGAGTALCLVEAKRPLVLAAAMILGYLGASRVLAPLRAELDVTSRARVLLRRRTGRVLLVHCVVPVIVTASASAVAVAGCALAGALPSHGGAAALAAVAGAPVLTGCAAMSARRGGRVPPSLLVAATADPSGGGLVIVSWATWWPVLAVLLGAVPIALVTGAGASAALGAALGAAAWTTIAIAGLAYMVDRDPLEV